MRDESPQMLVIGWMLIALTIDVLWFSLLFSVLSLYLLAVVD